MTSYDILVIILSTFLAIFIALAIAATILVIKLLNTLRAVAAKGEQIVDTAAESVDEVTEAFRRNANAVNILKIFSNFVNKDKK
ncbi:hypothetical protein EYC59_04050 [Candidatus Saccharibacteria bacterium]|nr:MAG: hypothetical protein EYC59_04050 [Candidatus Saccharibacteria bacterium]